MSALIAASKIARACKTIERRFGNDYQDVIRASKALQRALQRRENLGVHGRNVSTKTRRKADAAVSSAMGKLTAVEQKLNRSNKLFTSCLKRAV